MATFCSLPVDVRFLIYDLVLLSPQHRVYCRSLTSPFDDDSDDETTVARYNLLVDEYAPQYLLNGKGLNQKEKLMSAQGMSLLAMGIKGDFDFSIFYVNKTISMESRSNFFRKTIFFAGNAWDTSRLLYAIEDTIQPYMPQLERLEINAHLFWGIHVKQIQHTVEILCELARLANFRELSLVDSDALLVFLPPVIDNASHSFWLAALEHYNAKDYFNIRVFFNVESARDHDLSVRKRIFAELVESWVKDPVRDCEIINTLFRTTHAVTGGEIWLEDQIMWQNFSQIRELKFQGQDEDGNEAEHWSEACTKIVPLVVKKDA